jgi:Ran GTPase-activating protein (RanGAP) involved in mRNA processing and transport
MRRLFRFKDDSSH